MNAHAIDEGEIRAAASALEHARDRERALAAANVHGLDAVARQKLAGDYAVAQANAHQCWIALRKLQGLM
jgi:hypothetical protein